MIIAQKIHLRRKDYNMQDESTSNLRNILNQTSLNELDHYLEQHANIPSAYDLFNLHMKTYPISIGQIVKNCEGYISRSYVYDILNGQKTSPSRDIVIMICLAANMNLKQVRRLLETYHHRELYPKDDRDAVIAACFNSKQYNICKVNMLLSSYNLPLLSTKEQ